MKMIANIRIAMSVLLFVVSVMALEVGVYAQPKNHRFGEKVTLAPDATLVVTELDASQFRTRYASEFPDD